jgi:hypothetical protein
VKIPPLVQTDIRHFDMTLPRIHKSVILFIALIILPAVGACILFVSSRGPRPAVFTLPSEGQIQKMSATINDVSWYNGVSPVPTFDVPSKHYALVLSAMTPAERHEYPAPWDAVTVGQLDVDTKDGRRLTIKFCDCGKNPLCFSIDGTRFVRGGAYQPIVVIGNDKMYSPESMLFCEILRAIHRESVSQKPLNGLKRCAEELERTKGTREPERR